MVFGKLRTALRHFSRHGRALTRPSIRFEKAFDED
jgi:hypothetical protein